ncbi:MAG: riboflavin synthase [Solirubrobacteraceae bacterium]
MFTGLIEAIGEVTATESRDGGARIAVASQLAAELVSGDSISVNGVCLTATAADGSGFRADAMAETLRRSSLSELKAGARVNLELPLRVGDRLGGHIVQGHVDGVAMLVGVEQEGSSRTLRFEADPELTRLLAPKGSIALDGVSLTLSGLGEPGSGTFAVSLIPETLERTTLGALASGDRVNVELDVLAKHVERLIATTLEGR